MNKKTFCITGYLALIALLHGGAILKYEDPITDSQTEGILYEQKMEQEKDGVKAPATPRVIFYGGQGFLTKNSLDKYEKEMSAAQAGKKKETFNWSDWWEDKPADDTGSSSEKSLIADEEPVEPPASAADGQPEEVMSPESSMLSTTPGVISEEVSMEGEKIESDVPLPGDIPPASQPAASDKDKPSSDDWW